MRTLRTTAGGLLAASLVLASCASDADADSGPEQPEGPQAPGLDLNTDDLDELDMDELKEELEELYEELEDAWDDLPEELRSAHLEVGDCWGLSESVQLDPIPCAGPHIYEVIAVVDDFDPTPFDESDDDWLTREQAKQEARDELCEGAYAAVFGHPYSESQHLIEDTPSYAMMPNLIVCSVHSGPETDRHRGEIEGSLADHGHIG